MGPMYSPTSLKLTQPMPIEMVYSTTVQPAMTLGQSAVDLSGPSMLVSE